ncbi:MAG TPA: hypothetical protein DDX39_09710 [Bacteroidales bacterium]|nr:MAG: hypothetical protein A2W98_01665 [Bacteroidetes bacterium GWF2_33_38]OFY84739.1 MAG: hypothetical protein A2236_05005 [Bacteroidetes bacterium RIFOXYA2_FULL_33_7]HBF88904.1 hypothetical protein [Bacteroidales bacterium]
MEYNWTNKTILVAEDDDGNYFLLQCYLEETNINIIRALNGQEAIDICKTNANIDVILMDNRMPEKTGLEATIEIRKFNKNVPIVSVTAFAYDENEILAFEVGCNHFMTKPLTEENLFPVLEKYFSK